MAAGEGILWSRQRRGGESELVALADLYGPPIDRVLSYLSGLELMSARCSFVRLKECCDREEFWEAVCLREEMGLGSSALSASELAAIAPFVSSYRKLYAQARGLRRRPSDDGALLPFGPSRRPSLFAQSGVTNMCFCEVYDATNPEACGGYAERRVFGSLARATVPLDPGCGCGSKLYVPLGIRLPEHDNGFDQPLEARFVFQVDGELVPVADTFAFSGEGDARWLVSQSGYEVLSIFLDIHAINDSKGSLLHRAIFDLSVLAREDSLADDRPCDAPDLSCHQLLALLKRHRPALHAEVQCFQNAPADGVWCPTRPPLLRPRRSAAALNSVVIEVLPGIALPATMMV